MEKALRTLHDHVTEGSRAELDIVVVDDPGAGGACHEYAIAHRQTGEVLGEISFQNGPILEEGMNGITNEALLAVVIDRLRGFQSGAFSCPENAEALQMCEGALSALKGRTRARIARDVEGRSIA